MTTRVTFEQELKELNINLEEMGAFVENAIDQLTEAMGQHNLELAAEIVKSDRTVNDMERAIESRCLSIITRQQPIARDLRIVSAALKIVTDLERIGDHAVDIAELQIRSEHMGFEKISMHIPAMMTASRCMVHDALCAFVHQDMEEAERVIESDDIVDQLFNKVKYDIIEHLKKETVDADQCIDLMMIAKYLEKIGDHAVNIAEWSIFKETGSIDQIRLL